MTITENDWLWLVFRLGLGRHLLGECLFPMCLEAGKSDSGECALNRR